MTLTYVIACIVNQTEMRGYNKRAFGSGYHITGLLINNLNIRVMHWKITYTDGSFTVVEADNILHALSSLSLITLTQIRSCEIIEISDKYTLKA